MGVDSALYAHSANFERGPGVRHGLAEHLRSTGRLAAAFAEPFGAQRLAFALGLFHDAGKAECSWQQRLLERERAGRGRVGGKHWELGAKLLADAANVTAMAVLGHHGGLSTRHDMSALKKRETDDEDRTRERFFAAVPEARDITSGGLLIPQPWLTDKSLLDVGIRMVFSALVDADFLDTAAHFAGKPPPDIPVPVSWDALVARFENQRVRMLNNRLAQHGHSPIDSERAWLYEHVVEQAGLSPGVYRLPAPTGSGKTITAAGFALHHAARWGRSRVIVAVPFLTITEQNASVYRDLLGEDTVLEHHSQAEYDDARDHRARFLAENWDAQFVVTTTVQLFDSLFGRRPARSRKLHRLANAVLVLDEVQALPLTLLLPILDALRVLTEHFGTTVLLTSATQPAFQAFGAWADLPVVDLVSQPRTVELFTKLKRVNYEWRVDPQPSLAEVADEVCATSSHQALVVVNTIDHARQMYRLLRERTTLTVLHLSTRMCPRHRQTVLAEVTDLLARGRPILLVSTQLIEAGVDLDFPAVFRALAPAESLQQAAGRANREGARPDLGRVVIFDAHDAPVPKFYRTGVGSTRLFFGPEQDRADPDDLAALDSYYRHLYATTGAEHCERARAIQQARHGLDYLSVADGRLDDAAGTTRNRQMAFQMINDDTVPVVVTTYPKDPDDPVDQWLTELADPERRRAKLFSLLRPYIVTIPRRVVTNPAIAPMITPVIGELSRWDGTYDEHLGLGEGVAGTEMVL